jgi:hypothetical protein
MVQAAITAERIIVSFDFFRLMAPASKVTGIKHCNGVVQLQSQNLVQQS